MKKEIYYCDICQKEAGSPRSRDLSAEETFQVIFTTEQNEGRSTESYLEYKKIDICENCRNRILIGEALFAEGAMGHNKYYFK